MGERALVLPWHKLPGLGRISDGICDRRSAISYQLSAISEQRLALRARYTEQLSAISLWLSADR
ncbi:MAG: hypothetical protein F6K63_34265 [Moorea sp. SIO1G6]|uniref:hypothetical protein n=1 Tax=Moorena sp. SIO1G6 TaxID=2607840 RepID=UPI0013BF6AA7|nr:hypothetical protein [Moorena sp. SIO1G6]NET69195.1 hypothetical protein [Moorena sp. SIO1G6]